MIHLILTFLASFVFIWLRAFQQRNVAFDNYGWIMPTSLLMAVTEVYVIANVASMGYSLGLVLAMGLGGGLGATSAALVHKKWIKRNDQT